MKSIILLLAIDIDPILAVFATSTALEFTVTATLLTERLVYLVLVPTGVVVKFIWEPFVASE